MPNENTLPRPETRHEMFLAAAAGESVEKPEPITREEMFLNAISSGGGTGDAYTKAETDQLLDGKADLVDGKVPASQLPSYVDDTIEGYLYDGKWYDDAQHTTEITGESGKIYVDVTTNKSYRWTGSIFTRIDECPAFGETAGTIYEGNKGKANADAIAAIKDGTTLDSFADVEAALSGKANTADLSAVATSGSYTDLANKPTLGAAAAKGVDATPTASSTNLVESGGVRNVVNVLEGMNGAKNLLKVNSADGAAVVKLPCKISAGEIVVTIGNLTSSQTEGTSRMCFMRNGETIASDIYYAERKQNIMYVFTVDSGGADSLWIYASSTYNNAYSVSATNVMAIPKSIYDAGFTDFQPYALPVTTITPELIELVDSGAKNLAPLNSVSASSTGYFGETNINLPAGEYVMSYRLTTNYNFGVSITAGSDIVKSANHPPYNNTLIVEEIVANGNITKYKFYANQQANVSDFMICTKAAWDVSQKFVPYCPSMAEMYEMIKALQ